VRHRAATRAREGRGEATIAGHRVRPRGHARTAGRRRRSGRSRVGPHARRRCRARLQAGTANPRRAVASPEPERGWDGSQHRRARPHRHVSVSPKTSVPASVAPCRPGRPLGVSRGRRAGRKSAIVSETGEVMVVSVFQVVTFRGGTCTTRHSRARPLRVAPRHRVFAWPDVSSRHERDRVGLGTPA
jgi:hypothetical protein